MPLSGFLRAALLLPPLLLVAALAALSDDADREPAFVEEGEASWYGPGLDGKPTASGEIFDQEALTAAHPDLPLGATATVTNLENGRSVEVEITDRGPHVDDRAIDLSKGAAERLDMIEDGTAPVRIEASEDDLERAGVEDADSATP
jgi:rare lipoprotein A